MTTPLPADTAATGSVATSFAEGILQALGAPVNSANVGSLNDWFALEGGGGANNPLNTTLDTSGSTGSINSVGVQSYATPQDGVTATVDTLDSGSYSAIVAALKSGQGLAGGSSAISQELSTWSGGGYSSVSGAAASSTAAAGGTAAAGATGTAAAAAQLTAFTTPGDTLSLGAATPAASDSLLSPITGVIDLASSVARLAKDFNTLVGLVNALMADIEWLFVPSNWVRIFSFLFGVGALLPGLWALMKTGSGQQGDITMAIGILLVTFAGVMLFIAFHNLPTTITDLAGLLEYISEGITAGAAPDSGAPAFGPASSTAGDANVSGSAAAAAANPNLAV